MKKPFKLNAYYLVNMGMVDPSAALDDLNLDTSGKAVVHIDPDKYAIVDRGVHHDEYSCWVFFAGEREYCKRCDNSFVAGVTYIDSDGVEYLCKLDDDWVLVLLDESDGEMYFCNDYSPKDFTPKVGMIN